MGLKDRVRYLLYGPPLTKETNTMQAILATGNISARWMQQTYEAVCREGYMRNPTVYACIRQISEAFAGVRWDVYTNQEKTQKLTNHPLKSLIENPNPRQGKSAFMENLIAFLLLDGNSYLQCIGPDNKPPLELYVLRPDRMTVIPGTPLDPIAGYVYAVGNVRVPLDAPTIRHLKLFNPLDDWRGLSPMSAAAMSVDQSNASKAWNVSLLQNSARPPGAMSTQVSLDPEQYRRLKEEMSGEYMGYMNAGIPLLLDGGVQWTEMGLNPQDMDWMNGQQLSARETAIVFNIAPELIGDSSNKTYSNYGEARVALYQENVLPKCDWIRDELNSWLAPYYPDHPYLDYAKDDIEALQEDSESLWERSNGAFLAGWIRINEARTAVGLPEDPTKGEFYNWEIQKPIPGSEPGEFSPPAPDPALTVPNTPNAGNAGTTPATNANATGATTGGNGADSGTGGNGADTSKPSKPSKPSTGDQALLNSGVAPVAGDTKIKQPTAPGQQPLTQQAVVQLSARQQQANELNAALATLPAGIASALRTAFKDDFQPTEDDLPPPLEFARGRRAAS